MVPFTCGQPAATSPTSDPWKDLLAYSDDDDEEHERDELRRRLSAVAELDQGFERATPPDE